MPKRQSDKIKLITKFLDAKSVPNLKKIYTVDEILKLPASAYKFLTQADAKLFRDQFKIKTIRDFTTFDSDHPFDMLYKDEKRKLEIEHILQADPELEEKLKKAVTISQIIYRIQKESLSFINKEQKVIVAGLSNAGKTTILKKFGGQIGIKDLSRLTPTKGVERQEIITSDLALLIWDMGGQKQYRQQYLSEPSKYFLKVDLIIYVIDLQDPEHYRESIEYLKKIIEILEKLEENPYILLFIHKFDPDVKDQPEILLNVEHLKELIKTTFKGNEEFPYDIYLSSIYSALSREPKFSRYLKTTLEKTATLSDYKVEGMASVLESTLNGIIRLSESVMEQYNEVDRRLRILEGTESQSSEMSQLFPHPEYSTHSQQPIPLETPPSEDSTKYSRKKEILARNTVLEELKELFDKRTKKKEN